MNNIPGTPSKNFFTQSNSSNLLWQYVQSMNPETVAQLSKPDPEVAQIMEQNLRGILGNLPPRKPWSTSSFWNEERLFFKSS